MINYSELSGNAQRAFCIIDKRLFSEMKEEVWVTKEDLAWELQLSIPSVKVALRELKNKEIIETRNSNSSWMRIKEEYRYGK